MDDETLDDSVWFATTDPDIVKGMIVSEKPRPQESPW